MTSNGFNDRSNGQNGRISRNDQMWSQATRTIQAVDSEEFDRLFGSIQHSVPPTEPGLIATNAKVISRFLNDGGDTKYGWYVVSTELNGVPSTILCSVGYDRQDTREQHNAKITGFDAYMEVGATVGLFGELVGAVVARMSSGKAAGYFDLMQVTAVTKEILHFGDFDEAGKLPLKTKRAAPAQRETRPVREARPMPAMASAAK